MLDTWSNYIDNALLVYGMDVEKNAVQLPSAYRGIDQQKKFLELAALEALQDVLYRPCFGLTTEEVMDLSHKLFREHVYYHTEEHIDG